MSDLESPNYVHEKVNVIEITDTEVTRGLKGVKKGRAPGWDEMRAEMVDVAGEIGARWTKRLLNTCIHETMQSAGRLADRVNCPHIEKERRCTRPREAVFYIEPARRPQADNFQPGLATLLLAGPTGRQLCV